jgi:hypothetical protein
LILGDLYSYKQELKGFEAINLDSPDAFETWLIIYNRI